MSEPKKTSYKKLSLAPLTFDEALKGLLEAELPKENQEKKTSAKQRKKTIDHK